MSSSWCWNVELGCCSLKGEGVSKSGEGVLTLCKDAEVDLDITGGCVRSKETETECRLFDNMVTGSLPWGEVFP